MYAGFDPRYEIWPCPGFGELEATAAEIAFYFDEHKLAWHPAEVLAIVPGYVHLDYTRLSRDIYDSDALSDQVGMRNFNVAMHALGLVLADPIEEVRVYFAFGSRRRMLNAQAQMKAALGMPSPTIEELDEYVKRRIEAMAEQERNLHPDMRDLVASVSQLFPG